MKILVLNGPNLNLLGTREPEIYGRTTLSDIDQACRDKGKELGCQVDCQQSNHEGELVSWVQGAKGVYAALILNAGAYSHSSIALLDAIQATALPVIEVHISNVFRRESFRHHSYVSQAAVGVIAGLGLNGYLLALEALADMLRKS